MIWSETVDSPAVTLHTTIKRSQSPYNGAFSERDEGDILGERLNCAVPVFFRPEAFLASPLQSVDVVLIFTFHVDSSPCKPHSLFYQIVSSERQTSLSPLWLRLAKRPRAKGCVYRSPKTARDCPYAQLCCNSEEHKETEIDLGVDEAVSNADLHAQELDYQQELFEKSVREGQEVGEQVYTSCTQDLKDKGTVGKGKESGGMATLQLGTSAHGKSGEQRRRHKERGNGQTSLQASTNDQESAEVVQEGAAQHKWRGSTAKAAADQHNRGANKMNTTNAPRLKDLPLRKTMDEEAAMEWIRMRLKPDGLEEAMGEYDFDVEIFEDGVTVRSDSLRPLPIKERISACVQAADLITKEHVGVQVERATVVEPGALGDAPECRSVRLSYDEAPRDRVRRTPHSAIDHSPDILLTLKVNKPYCCGKKHIVSGGEDEVLLQLEAALVRSKTIESLDRVERNGPEGAAVGTGTALSEQATDVQQAADALRALSTPMMGVETARLVSMEEFQGLQHQPSSVSAGDDETKARVNTIARIATDIEMISEQRSQEDSELDKYIDSGSTSGSKKWVETIDCGRAETKKQSKRGKPERLGEVGREYYQPRRTSRHKTSVNYSENSRSSHKGKRTQESEVEQLNSRTYRYQQMAESMTEEDTIRSDEFSWRYSKRAKVQRPS